MAQTYDRIAVFGDVHGCIDELVALYSALSWMSLDGIWSVGDLIDRGPNSGAVVDFCRMHNVHLVKGNHESTIEKIISRSSRYTGNPDKQRTIASINATSDKEANWKYLFDSPYLWAIDNLNLLIAHAGIWPKIPLSRQAPTYSIATAQAINPDKLGDSVWYSKMAKANEDAGYQKYIPWQDLYDSPENLVYGHSVYSYPNFVQNADSGWTLGIDTGVPFGGSLTAVVLPERILVQVQANKIYWTAPGSRSVPPPFHRDFSGD